MAPIRVGPHRGPVGTGDSSTTASDSNGNTEFSNEEALNHLSEQSEPIERLVSSPTEDVFSSSSNQKTCDNVLHGSKESTSIAASGVDHDYWDMDIGFTAPKSAQDNSFHNSAISVTESSDESMINTAFGTNIKYLEQKLIAEGTTVEVENHELRQEQTQDNRHQHEDQQSRDEAIKLVEGLGDVKAPGTHELFICYVCSFQTNHFPRAIQPTATPLQTVNTQFVSTPATGVMEEVEVGPNNAKNGIDVATSFQENMTALHKEFNVTANNENGSNPSMQHEGDATSIQGSVEGKNNEQSLSQETETEIVSATNGQATSHDVNSDTVILDDASNSSEYLEGYNKGQPVKDKPNHHKCSDGLSPEDCEAEKQLKADIQLGESFFCNLFPLCMLQYISLFC